VEFDAGLGGSGEQVDFWWDLEPALIAAGWTHIPWNQVGGIFVTQGPSRPISGAVAVSDVEIHLHPNHRATLEPAATALVAALNDVGIAAKDAGFNAHSMNEAAIHILIGDKR
jgi:hypothetical protein